MSTTTERKPLLSDKELRLIAGVPLLDREMDHECGMILLAAKSVSSAYEAMIRSGKLRVVEKAIAMESAHNDEWYQPYLTCSRCAVSWMSPADGNNVYEARFCPGCGAKIVE